jgi:DNA-binding beta-propeller fold protein YncE
VGAKKRHSFLDRLAGKGQDSMFLLRPLSVAVDEKGAVFVGDFGLGIVGMDPVAHKMWRFADVSQKSLAAPAGVAVDSKFVYATDANTDTLATFDKEGHFIQSLGQNDGIKRPVGVAVDEARNLVVVVNGGNNTVLLFDRTLKLIKKIGSRGTGPGQFNFPTFCCVVPGTGFAISDTGNFRVQIFDYAGKYVRSFGKVGDTSGTFSRPKGIAVDPDGNLYVVDSTFANFQVFRLDGQVLTHVGSGGAGKAMFQIPSGIAIGRDGAIYVADEINRRIQRFQYFPEAKKDPAAPPKDLPAPPVKDKD